MDIVIPSLILIAVLMVVGFSFLRNHSNKPNYIHSINIETPLQKAINQTLTVYNDKKDIKSYIQELERLEKEKVKEAELYLSFYGKNKNPQPALDLYDEAIFYADMVQTHKKSMTVNEEKSVEVKPKGKRTSKVNKKTQKTENLIFAPGMRLGPSENQDRIEYYYLKKAGIRHRNKDLSGALNEIDKAIKKNPTIGLYDYRARLNLEKGDEKGACVDWKKAKSLGADRTNLIKKFCNTREDTKIVFFDVETTGLPANNNSDADKICKEPHLVQIAWLVYDFDGIKISEANYIIKPNGFEIPLSAATLHGIATERALREGTDLPIVLKEFESLVQGANYIVAHNIPFDISVLSAEFARNNLKFSFAGIDTICTMRDTAAFCKIRKKTFKGFLDTYKWPSLSELHQILFGTGIKDAHNAEVDVRITAKCFWELKKRDIINIRIKKPEIKKPQTEIIDIHHELFYDAYDFDDHEANMRDMEDWNIYYDDPNKFA